ncbi:MAG: formylglycine-generating enzyme family protein [Saprospiraceae bacterium]|nr:formylglycine-generating enzyme family protein [Saprospiraceae bacterium]
MATNSSEIIRKIEFKGDLIETLKHYYAKGDDIRFLKWIAACAIYPTIHWDLTLSYGKLLSDRTNDLSFVSLDNLLEINRLPWFIEGKIPQQVREELLLFLEKNDAEFLQAARKHLHELMQNNPPAEDSAAFEDYQMNVVINEMMMKNDAERQKELEEKFRKMVEAGVEPDFTVLKYLDKPQSPLDFYVPNAWKDYVFNDGKPFLGRKNWTWAVPIWVILSVFIMAYYPSLPHCDGTKADYENRELCLNGFADEMLLREFITLDFIQNENIIGADSMVNLVREIYKKEVFQSGVIDENGNLFFVNNKGKMISGNLSYFQNVSTAYYNKGVPFYNQSKTNEYASVENESVKDAACLFFQKAYDIDSTVQIYRDLSKECNGETFKGYILPLLRGKVLDATTKKPITNVQITTDNGLVVQTDKAGEYSLNLGKEPILSLSILFEKKQYLSQSQNIELRSDLEILDTIYLSINKKAINIPSLPHPEKERQQKPIDNRQQNDNGKNPENQFPTNGDNNSSPVQQPTEQTTPTKTQPKATIHIPTTVKVKGGTFYMGSGRDRDNIKHTVNLSDYQIGKYEVTNKEFLDFVQELSTSKVESLIDIRKRGSTKMYEQNGVFYIEKGYENHPVVGITWDGATEYCEWLSKKLVKNIVCQQKQNGNLPQKVV